MKNKLIVLLSILLFTGLSKAQEVNKLSHVFTINKVNLVIEKGDITKSKTEAIVNAANEELLGGAGVCGAIFNAAGWNELQAACNKYPENSNVRCQVGQACITDSFQLKSNGIKHIIHAVGPDCRVIKDKAKQDQLLESAYRNSLVLAEKNNIQSIAFPFISSAIYAFPKDRAADIALNSVIEYTKSNKNFSEIHFVLFSQEDFDLFCKTIKEKINSNLIIAAQKGHVETIKELIKSGADVNYNEGCDWPRAGRSILTYAINGGSFKAVEILLEAGARVEDIADVPSELNILEPKTRNVPHISYAIMVNAPIEIIELLIRFSKNINETDIYIGWTPYMIANYYKNTQAMIVLSKAGAGYKFNK